MADIVGEIILENIDKIKIELFDLEGASGGQKASSEVFETMSEILKPDAVCIRLVTEFSETINTDSIARFCNEIRDRIKVATQVANETEQAKQNSPRPPLNSPPTSSTAIPYTFSITDPVTIRASDELASQLQSRTESKNNISDSIRIELPDELVKELNPMAHDAVLRTAIDSGFKLLVYAIVFILGAFALSFYENWRSNEQHISREAYKSFISNTAGYIAGISSKIDEYENRIYKYSGEMRVVLQECLKINCAESTENDLAFDQIGKLGLDIGALITVFESQVTVLIPDEFTDTFDREKCEPVGEQQPIPANASTTQREFYNASIKIKSIRKELCATRNKFSQLQQCLLSLKRKDPMRCDARNFSAIADRDMNVGGMNESKAVSAVLTNVIAPTLSSAVSYRKLLTGSSKLLVDIVVSDSQ